MGRIERVVLHNFKSYAGTHTLGPMTDFTAIIGPNGAGTHITPHPPQHPSPPSPLPLNPLSSPFPPSPPSCWQASPTSWTPSAL